MPHTAESRKAQWRTLPYNLTKKNSAIIPPPKPWRTHRKTSQARNLDHDEIKSQLPIGNEAKNEQYLINSWKLCTDYLMMQVGGFHLPFMLFGVIHAMSLPVCYLMLPKCSSKERSTLKELQRLEKGDKVEEMEKKILKPWDLLKIPRTMLMALVILVTGVYWSFLDANLEEHLSPLQLTKTEINLMFILISVWYGVTCPAAGWITNKIPRTWPMVSIGLFGCALACQLLGPLPIFRLNNTIWLNVIALTIVTIFMATATVPAYEAAVLFTIEAGYEDDFMTYGVVSSLIMTSFALGSFMGAFVGGFMVESLGFPLAASIIGGILLLWSGIITVFFTCCDTSAMKHDKDIRGNKLKCRLLRKSAEMA